MRLQKVVIRHWTGDDLEGCCLVYLALFGERFLIPTPHLQFAESAVKAPAVPGVGGLFGSVGKAAMGAFFFDISSIALCN